MLLYDKACTASRTLGFCNPACYHAIIKSDLRISVKDYRRNKNLKIPLQRATFTHRQFQVSMNDSPWKKDGRPVSPAKLFTSLGKPIVKSF
jgi:hypothetical protein